MILRDDFTPHGYLDNPYHSWKLNPSGVLRSLPPLGMGWHVPNLGSYARNQFQYTAHLTIGLKIGDLALVTSGDFDRHHCVIMSHLHTRNRFEYTCVVPQYDLTLTARYFLVHEHALGCVLSLSTRRRQPFPVTCYLTHLHTHNPSTSRLWEHGFYAFAEPDGGTPLAGTRAVLGLASEGDAFVHGVRAAGKTALTFGEMGYAITLDDISAWARGAAVAHPAITQHQDETGWQLRAVALPCTVTLGGDGDEDARCILNVVLARGVSQDQARQHWEDGIEEIAHVEAAHQADDEQFWSHAPQLSGDWPANWRRGLIYDLETLQKHRRESPRLFKRGMKRRTFSGKSGGCCDGRRKRLDPGNQTCYTWNARSNRRGAGAADGGTRDNEHQGSQGAKEADAHVSARIAPGRRSSTG